MRRMDLLRHATPFDARCMVALIAIPAAWKVLSLDFEGLRLLCGRPPLFSFRPEFLYHWLTQNRCFIFETLAPSTFQILIASLLVAFVIVPSRWILFPAIVLLWLLDTSAFLYRATLYTLDTPLALLTLIFFVPVSLRRAIGTSLTPEASARAVMLCALMFVATYYVLAGISKFYFAWDWVLVIKVGNYYPLSFIWHAQVMPPVIDGIAKGTSDFLLAYPLLDYLGATVVLVEQFIWFAAPFSILLRSHAGLFACAYHIVVALTTGIVFITWVFIALAVTVPFSQIVRFFSARFRPLPDINPYEMVRVSDKTLIAVSVVAIALAAIPSSGIVYPPFHNYFAFGWRYKGPNEVKEVYRVGYRSPVSGKIESFPLNQGGFLDFRQTAMMDSYTRLAILDPYKGALDEVIGAALKTMIDGTRGIGVNGWLLGRFRFPEHLLGLPGLMDMRQIDTFYLMRGTPRSPASGVPIKVDWRLCGQIIRGGPDGAKAFTRFEACRDG